MRYGADEFQRSAPPDDDPQRRQDHRRDDQGARPEAGRVPAHPRPHRPRAELHRTRHLLRHVERALLVQILEEMAAHPAHQRRGRHPGSGRECRRGRHRRRRLRRLQDGEPQPPLLHRALSGRGDRRRRHIARRLHHGRAPGRGDERAALRRAGPSQDEAPRRRRGRRRRRLRQLLRRADGRRRGRVRRALQRQHPGQRLRGGPRENRRHLLFRGEGRRPARRLSRRQDRPRRRRRRDHGLGRIRRQDRGEAPDRAGRRSLHRKMPAGSLPRADGVRRGHRHPGHGRGRPHLLRRRDGRQGRPRHRAGSRPRAGARGAHVGL